MALADRRAMVIAPLKGDMSDTYTEETNTNMFMAIAMVCKRCKDI